MRLECLRPSAIPTQQNKNFVEFGGGVSPSEPGFWRFGPFWDRLATAAVSEHFLWIIVLKHLQLFVIFFLTTRPSRDIPTKPWMSISWT